MRKQPQVTEQTRRNLMNGFWKLYKDEAITKITISKICDAANYERTTFYRYFSDIHDILSQLENEIIQNIKEDTRNGSKHPKQGQIFIEGFKRFTEKYGEYITIFYENGNKSFYDRFKELVKEDVYDYLKFKISDEKQKEYIFEFMFSSLISSYDYWYNNQDMMSLEDFVKFSNGILMNGTKTILK